MPFLNLRLSLTDGIHSYGSTYKLSLLTSQIQTFNPDLSANFMLIYANFYSILILCVTIYVQSKMDFIFFILIWLSYCTTSSLYCTKKNQRNHPFLLSTSESMNHEPCDCITCGLCKSTLLSNLSTIVLTLTLIPYLHPNHQPIVLPASSFAS